MKSLIPILLFLITTTQLRAQVPVVIDLPGSGRYVIEVTIDVTGKATIVQLPIYSLRGSIVIPPINPNPRNPNPRNPNPNNPNPNNPNNPNPNPNPNNPNPNNPNPNNPNPNNPNSNPNIPNPNLSKAAQTVKNLTAALDVEPELIEAIKVMYGTVGDSIRDGSIAVANANKALSSSTNAIGRRGGLRVRRELEPWRKGVSDILLDFAAAGKYETKDQIADALEEIVSGIQAHQDSSGLFSRLDPEKVERWIKIIMMIIKMFIAL